MGQRKNKHSKKDTQADILHLNETMSNFFEYVNKKNPTINNPFISNPKSVKFICPDCNYQTNISTFSVMIEHDKVDNINAPPTFKCKRCSNTMYPIYYKSINGIVFEYKSKN